jgi:hypothetical protein
VKTLYMQRRSIPVKFRSSVVVDISRARVQAQEWFVLGLAISLSVFLGGKFINNVWADVLGGD